MVVLATCKSSARTAFDISRQSQVPLDYLSKILNSLARAGLVSGQRGPGGGFKQVRPAAQITVLEGCDCGGSVETDQKLPSWPRRAWGKSLSAAPQTG